MKNFILGFGSLLVGTIIGFTTGYYISKNKYLVYADKEIDSVKKLYENHFEKKSEDNSNEKRSSSLDIEEDNKKYTDYTKTYSGDTDGDNIAIERPLNKRSKSKKIYSIDGVNVGELDGYKIITYIYYKDKVVADEDNNIIGDYEEILGGLLDISKFDETGALYIRNENLSTDFEILLSDRLYSEDSQ